MGRPRTSGSWKKGQGGRPHGAKDRYPRSARRLVEQLIETYGTDPNLLDAAMRRGLLSRPDTAAPYCRMVIEHLKGAPDLHIDVAAALARKCIDELHPGPTKGATMLPGEAAAKQLPAGQKSSGFLLDET